MVLLFVFAASHAAMQLPQTQPWSGGQCWTSSPLMSTISCRSELQPSVVVDGGPPPSLPAPASPPLPPKSVPPAPPSSLAPPTPPPSPPPPVGASFWNVLSTGEAHAP